MATLPRSRAGLLKHPLEDQVLVYEAETDTVHLLDQSTACVLDLLGEGGWTAEGILAEASERLGTRLDPSSLLVALDSLRTAGLLEGGEAEASFDLERREFVRRFALAGTSALLGAAVISLSPSAGQAQSNLCAGQPLSGDPPGTPCDSDDDCCGTSLRKCVEYGGSTAKRCCFWDKGTGKDCLVDPPSGVCCASAPPLFTCSSGTCP